MYPLHKINEIDRFRKERKFNVLELNRNMLMGVHDLSLFDGYHIPIEKYSFYPDMESFYRLLSVYLNISKSNFIVTRGAEGSIKTLFSLFDFKCCLLGDPSYKMYDIYGYVYNIDIVKIKANELTYDNIKKSNLIDKIDLLCIVNPNPYYDYWIDYDELHDIISLCEKNNIIVLLDEIYIGYGAFSFLTKYNIDDYDNLLIINSFSKSHMLPSLKVGYMIFNKKLKRYMHSNRLSYEISMLDCELIKHIINKETYFLGFWYKVYKMRKQFRDNYNCHSNYTFNIYFPNLTNVNFKNIVVGEYNKGIYFSAPMNEIVAKGIIKVLHRERT